MFTNMEATINTNIDFIHWRACYHHLIEALRKYRDQLASNSKADLDSSRKITITLEKIIEEGISFYSKIIERIEIVYLKFSVDDMLASSSALICNPDAEKRFRIKNREMNCSLMCINRLLICIGDLCRYKELLFGGLEPHQRDYSQARTYYLKAQRIAPKSSRAYHQLAVLALYTKRRLDVCYYYMRCLYASQPLLSVRQSLYALFDEVHHKCESFSASTNDHKKQNKNNQLKLESKVKNKNEKQSKSRVELWYIPSTLKTNKFSLINEEKEKANSKDNDIDCNYCDENEENIGEEENESDEDVRYDNYKKLSVHEICKRFLLDYINTVGKLFSKVAMETYSESCSRMLHEFNEILRRCPCPLGRTRLVQISTINIAIIELIKQHQYGETVQSEKYLQRSQMLECAIQLGMDIFTLMIKRFTISFAKSSYIDDENDENFDEKSASGDNNNDQLGIDADTHNWRELLPAIKVFADWLLCSNNLWLPMPDQLPPDLGPCLDRKAITANMFNTIAAIALDELEVDIRLEEDLELSGFRPLANLSSIISSTYSNDKAGVFVEQIDQRMLERLKNRKRMRRVLLLADYLCNLDQPLFRYDLDSKRYIVLLHSNEHHSTTSFSLKSATDVSSSILDTDAEVNDDFSDDRESEKQALDKLLKDEDLSQDESHSDNHESRDEDEELSELKKKHKMLIEARENAERVERERKSIIDQQQQRMIEIEVRPKFIVPDTNCFIDHLSSINAILRTGYYIIVVPLLVINELDKLAKPVASNNRGYDDAEHAEYVQKQAKLAIGYLNDKFEKREKNLKAMTAQGSILETIQYRTEELKSKGTNDELILGCCLHYCRDNARNFMPKNKCKFLYYYDLR
jgi:protein SMG6